MNIGLITSIVIAGLLSLGIAANSIRLQQSSAELSISQTQKERISTLAELVSYDVSKIGYNLDNVSDITLTKAEDYKINFFANIDNSADGSIEEVKWEWLKDEPIEETENPKDFLLFRSIDGVHTDVRGGIVEFIVHYYDEYGATEFLPTPLTAEEFASVKQISVKIILESNDPTFVGANDEGTYQRYAWEKRFSPINLRPSNN